jgi:hypothetical protein
MGVVPVTAVIDRIVLPNSVGSPSVANNSVAALPRRSGLSPAPTSKLERQ